MEVATLNKWMFRTYSRGEAGLINIYQEVIQRNKAVTPGGKHPTSLEEIWAIIHASAPLYFSTLV